LREAEAAAGLDHPHIVPVHEVGEAANVCYIVSAYCPGPTLAAWIREQPRPVSARLAASLILQLAAAMQHAHERGVLHRDLKPTNVLLSSPANNSRSSDEFLHEGGDEDLHARITDFGLAKLVDQADASTRSGAILGTPAYMAPEQAEGRLGAVGPASDVYALGVILFELLTGRPPFQAISSWDTLNQVIHAEPTPPRRLQPRVPRDLQTVCLKCLRKQPSERYPTAAGLAGDLRLFLEGKPVQARQLSSAEKVVRWARRNPAWASLFLTLVVTAVALPIGLLWHLTQLQQAFDEAQSARKRAQANETAALTFQYASDMRLAQELLRAGDPFQVPNLLDRHLPATADAVDRRGFEWWYLTRHRPVARTPITASPEKICFVGYGPDNRTLVTASRGRDQTLTVWDADAGQPRFRVKLHHPHRDGVLVTVAPDGQTMAAITAEKTVTVWDVVSGKERSRLEHTEAIWAIDFSLDGRTLATLGAGPITLWDWTAGKVTRTVPGAEDKADEMILTPDGQSVVVRRLVGMGLLVLDLNTGKPRPPAIAEERFESSLTRSPKGKLLAWIQDGNLLASHDPVTQRRSIWWGAPPGVCLRSLAVSPDEKTVVVGDENGRLFFLAVEGGEIQRSLRWQARAVSSLGFSLDGRWLAVGTEEGQMYQLEVAAPNAAEQLTTTAALGPVAFSPDRRTVAVAEQGSTVRLIDPQTSKVKAVLGPLAHDVVAFSWSGDGRLLAIIGGGVRGTTLWDVSTGRLVRHFGAHHHETLTQVRCVPTGRLLITGNNEGTLRLWDYSTGEELGAVKGAYGGVDALEITSDGSVLAAAFANGVLRTWRIVENRLQPLADAKLSSWIAALSMTADGRLLATGEDNGRVVLWDHSEQRLQEKGTAPSFPSSPSQAGIHSLAFSGDGSVLLVADSSPHLRLWDLNQQTCRHKICGPTDRWWSAAALSSDGCYLATRNSDGIASVWDLRNMSVLCPSESPNSVVHSLAVLPDGQTLATGSEAGGRLIESNQLLFDRELRYHSQALRHPAQAIRFWDVSTRKEQAAIQGPLSMMPPDLVAVCPNGRTLAAGSRDGSIWLWDLSSRKMTGRKFVSPHAEKYSAAVEAARALAPVRPEYTEAVQALAFSSDGRLLLATSDRGAVATWDVESGNLLPALPGDFSETSWIGFVPNSSIAVFGRGGQMEFWNLNSRALEKTLGRIDEPRALCGAFSGDGSLLAVAAADRRIRLWELEKASERAQFIGHSDRITAVAFCPDRKTLASTSWDETVRLWSIAAGQEVSTLVGHHGRVHCLVFTPDGKTLITGGQKATGGGEVLWWRTTPN
jgi:WD40 repeat protein